MLLIPLFVENTYYAEHLIICSFCIQMNSMDKIKLFPPVPENKNP